jgi:RND family efflux transporter MFP subunit
MISRNVPNLESISPMNRFHLHRRSMRLLTCLVVAGCGADARGEPVHASDPDPIPIRTAAVVAKSAAVPVRATGVVGPEDEVQLSFKMSGVISAIEVDEGATVRPGETLATLDLSEIDAHVDKARSALTKAERDLARAQALYADSVATLEQLQDAATSAEIAAANLRAATFNHRYATIIAPMHGVILQRNLEAGEMVQPGQTVLVLGGTSGGYVLRVALADRAAVRIREGDPAEIHFEALPERSFRGRVSQMAAAADPRTGTYEVEVAIEGSTQLLAAGLIGRLEIHPSSVERIHLIPVEALMEADGEQGVVYTVTPDDARARRLEVSIGFLQGQQVAVQSGLDGVSAVVTDGVAYLTDGAAVRRVR